MKWSHRRQEDIPDAELEANFKALPSFVETLTDAVAEVRYRLRISRLSDDLRTRLNHHAAVWWAAKQGKTLEELLAELEAPRQET
jgi:hypothetical protein